MKVTLHIWRQRDARDKGHFETHSLDDVSPHMSFLELLDVLNQRIILDGGIPVAFEHDCREGICGACGLMINGSPHGPLPGTTTCQLHMRHFTDGDEIWVEPWRSKAFPVIRDLVVDRSSFDQIIQSGGFISVRAGSAPSANAIPISKAESELAMDSAECIGCGACVAACPNGSASLFIAAKISHLGHLPQGQPERDRRALNMTAKADQLGFGYCTNYTECETACPKNISIAVIGRMNSDFHRAVWANAHVEKGKRELF